MISPQSIAVNGYLGNTLSIATDGYLAPTRGDEFLSNFMGDFVQDFAGNFVISLTIDDDN